MKRTGNLYQQIAEPDNLRLAFVKASRGKQDRSEVITFRRNLDQNLAILHWQLIRREVPVGEYHFFTVYDPKERRICAASFRERVLHHAIMNICEPVLDRYAVYDSWACRTGKGQRAAVIRAKEFAASHSWYLKLDIRKYFDSIDHETLLFLLERRFKDLDLLALFRRILATYATTTGKGLPIGNLVSQHFANFYLGLFDHWIKEKRAVSGYLRYMDDFVVFAANREALKRELSEIKCFLQDRLKLQLNENIQLNRTETGIPFLGMRVYPQRIRLSPRSRLRFCRKLVEYEQRATSGEWSEQELSQRVNSLVEFTIIADTKGFRGHVIFRKRGFS